MSKENLTQPGRLSIVLSCQATKFEAATFKGDFEFNLVNIANLGYQGVELAIRDPQEMDYPKLYRMLADVHLRVPAIGTGQAWGEEHLSFTDANPEVRARAIQRVQAHIPSAARLNALIIIGLIRGRSVPAVARDQTREWLRTALRQCARLAADSGVSLCVEPINRYETDLVNTVQDGLDLIQQLDEPNLGLLLDTFHMNIEERSLTESILLAGAHLFHFHVADSNRWHPGAGHINFPECWAALEKLNYQGYVSGEFLPMPDPNLAAKNAIAYLKSTTTEIKL